MYKYLPTKNLVALKSSINAAIDENNISSLEGTDISGVAVVSAIFSKSDIRTATSFLSSVIHGRILR